VFVWFVSYPNIGTGGDFPENNLHVAELTNWFEAFSFLTFPLLFKPNHNQQLYTINNTTNSKGFSSILNQKIKGYNIITLSYSL
jgi:hypothetical protein